MLSYRLRVKDLGGMFFSLVIALSGGKISGPCYTASYSSVVERSLAMDYAIRGHAVHQGTD